MSRNFLEVWEIFQQNCIYMEEKNHQPQTHYFIFIIIWTSGMPKIFSFTFFNLLSRNMSLPQVKYEFYK